MTPFHSVVVQIADQHFPREHRGRRARAHSALRRARAAHRKMDAGVRGTTDGELDQRSVPTSAATCSVSSSDTPGGSASASARLTRRMSRRRPAASCHREQAGAVVRRKIERVPGRRGSRRRCGRRPRVRGTPRRSPPRWPAGRLRQWTRARDSRQPGRDDHDGRLERGEDRRRVRGSPGGNAPNAPSWNVASTPSRNDSARRTGMSRLVVELTSTAIRACRTPPAAWPAISSISLCIRA